MTQINNKNEWWRGSAIYQIYPRSFMDSNNDGIGDLRGITDKLDYIASLNVDAIWISPFFLSPMKDFGYDVSNFCAVDPMFGTMDDFDALAKKAHKLNLKIIIDLVLNHTSDQHEWFIESSRSQDNDKSDWFVWADPKPDGSAPNNWQSIFGGQAWTFHTSRGQYYMHSFLKEQPELNFHNPLVQDAVLDVAKFWLNKGVDGFRLDTANHYFCDAQLRDNPAKTEKGDRGIQFDGLWPYAMQQHVYDKSRPENIAFLEKFRALMDEYENGFLVGEIGDDEPYKMAADYTYGDKRLHTAYSTAMMGGMHETVTASDIIGPVSEELAMNGKSWPCWAYSNHDVVRVMTRWGKNNSDNNPNFAKMLLASLSCLRGTFCMYQGEELGLKEATLNYEDLQDPWGIALWPEWQGRDGCRTPMPWTDDPVHAGFTSPESQPWLPVCRGHIGHAVSIQNDDPQSVLNFTRDFLKWRKHNDTIKNGKIEFCDFGENVLGFVRHDDDQSYLCVFNLTDSEKSLQGIEETKLVYGLESSLGEETLSLSPFGFAICS